MFLGDSCNLYKICWLSITRFDGCKPTLIIQTSQELLSLIVSSQWLSYQYSIFIQMQNRYIDNIIAHPPLLLLSVSTSQSSVGWFSQEKLPNSRCPFCWRWFSLNKSAGALHRRQLKTKKSHPLVGNITDQWWPLPILRLTSDNNSLIIDAAQHVAE